MKNFILLFFTFLSFNSIFSQTTACDNSSPICSIGSLPSTATTSTSFGQLACLTSTANGNWYTIQSAGSGLMVFNLHQGNNPPFYNNRDVDFACWGPFNSPPNCSNIVLGDCPTCPSDNFVPNPAVPPVPAIVHSTTISLIGNIIDCSYSASQADDLVIPNASLGE